MANVKITALTNIGSNILYSALIPMVNMAGTPVTQQGNIQILGNYILSGAGSANFAPAYLSNLAYSVVNAAQPNITSVGTLTSLAVTGNVTSNSYMTANFFVGDGGLLTNVSSAGTSIANGTSNVSIPAAGGNINISRGGVANIVVVTGTGVNVAGTLNVTGNANTGNIGATAGVFTGAITGSTTLNITGNANVGNLDTSGNITAAFYSGNGSQLTGIVATTASSLANGTSNVSIPAASGNVNTSVGGTANVLVVSGTGITIAGNTTTTNLNITGNVTSNLLPNANITYNLGSSSQRWKDIWLSNSTIYLGNSTISAGDSNSVVFSGSVQADGNITTSDGNAVTITTTSGNTSSAWTFDTDGNFTLPGNTWAVNYANGSQVPLGGGSNANTGNFIFTANTMSLDGSANSNLYIQNDDAAVARIIIPSSADANTVELALESSGLSGIQVLTGTAYEHTWHFDYSGNFNAPGNVIMEGTQIFAGPGSESLGLANATLIISSNSSAYIQAVINNVSDNGSADWVAQGHLGDDEGGWIDMGFNSISHNEPLYSLTGPGDGYIISQTFYPGQVPGTPGGNLVLATGVEGTVRDIIFGTGGFESANAFARMSDANNAFEFARSGAAVSFPAGSEIGEVGASGEFGINSSSNNDMFIKTAYFDGAFTNEYTWTFTANGATIFPTLTVDLHNGGNQTAQTLQFGDNTQQAIITGPTPDANVTAQRLIIQGQRASGPGEGGDVYLWAGDSDTAGGDIKIYAGDADNVSTGYGGYVNIEGGTGFDGGGYVSLRGGESSNGQGAYAQIVGGQGGTIGGLANLKGGYGNATGGNVNIWGGGSGNGQANEGYVNIQTGGNTWTFDTSGNLTVPGSIITSGGNITGANVISANSFVGNGNLKLQPDPANASAYLDIFLTGGPDIHIAGNGETVILGTDNFANVAVNVNGNVYIQSGDANGTHTWDFDTAGNLTLPGNIIAINYADGNRVLGNITFRDEIVIGTGTSNLISGLYLAPSSSSANANMYLRVRGNINDEPTHIHFDTGNNQYYNQYIGDDNKYILLANTGNIVINSNDISGNSAQWTFGADGQLTLPGNLVITGNTSVFGTDSALIQSTDDLPLIAISSGANGAIATSWVEDIGNIGTSNIASVYANPTVGSKIVRIAVGQNGGPGPNLWDFSANGTTIFPGDLIGNGASPAPSISGFNSANFAGNIQGANISTTGNISGNTNGYTIGYLDIPQVSASNTTLALTDAGKHYYSTSSGNFTLTVPNNTSVSFATGTAISIVVQSTGNVLVNAASGVTLYMAGNSTTANRVVSNYGMATLLKVATDTWFINGTGVA